LCSIFKIKCIFVEEILTITKLRIMATSKKEFTVKKMFGAKTLVVLDINADLIELYKKSMKENLVFMILENGSHYQYSASSLYSRLKLSGDITKIFA